MLNWPERARLKIRSVVQESIEKGIQAGIFPISQAPSFLVERARRPGQGDFGVNAPLVLASACALPVSFVGLSLLERLKPWPQDVENVFFADPGFLNFSMSKCWLQDALLSIYREQAHPESQSREESLLHEEHPLFYAQYSYIRMRNLLRQMELRGIKAPDAEKINIDYLNEPEELVLLRRMMDFNMEATWIGSPYEKRFNRFIDDLTDGFRNLMDSGIFRDKNAERQETRMAFLICLSKVLKLALMQVGIHAPVDFSSLG